MKNAPSEEEVRAWVRLIRSSQVLLGALESAFKAADLPPLVWYDVLLELERAGEAGLRPFELVEEMLLAQYNLSRLLARMEQAAVLERLDCPDDGRGQVVRITKQGRALRRRMWRVYGPAIARLLGAKLEPTEQQQLAKLLGKLLPA